MSSRSFPDDAYGEDFGPRVDLTARIREILLNYPEGTSVLKELLQNADDAQATHFVICVFFSISCFLLRLTFPGLSHPYLNRIHTRFRRLG